MHRTTIYLPDDLRRDLAHAAQRLRRSEADIIRGALGAYVRSLEPPQPTLPLFRSKASGLAERVDEALRGFGER